MEQAAFYEHQMHLGSKAIFHLEAFVAKFMHLYLVFLEETMSAFM
jgi:replication factor C subunit 3/5